MFAEQAWILNRASLTPNRLALVNLETNEHWTYRQLTLEIAKWSHFFEVQGLQSGSRVAVFSRNNSHLFAILFACGLRGLIYVPLNWRLSAEELNEIVADATPSLLLYDQGIPCPLQLAMMYPIQQVLPSATIASSIELDLNEPWLMIYTGGTTGKAKGVVLSFNSVNWNAINTIISWGLCEDDCTLNYMPMFHTGGLNALSIPLLMAGGTVVIGDKFEAETALKAINFYKTTISLFVPTMYQAMITTNYFHKSSFPTVKVFLSGGAPCPLPIYDAFFKKGLFFKEGYGLTEAGPNNFYISREEAYVKKGAVGKSMQFNEAKIINQAGESCAAHEVGELFVRGKHMFRFYWNNQQETDNTIRDGWLRTGDLATMDEEGYFYIVGRRKDMIISGGENVYPQEVEQCILRHQLVKEAAVIGAPDNYWGEIVTAFIVCHHKSDTLVDEVENLCRSYLGHYKIPKKIIMIDELPKTIVGKIDKKALQLQLKSS